MKSLVIIAALTLSQCGHPEIKTDSACKVLQETLYADGKFMLSGEELDHLSEANNIKVTAVKIFYRKSCLKKP